MTAIIFPTADGSALELQLHGYGTNIAGDWDVVFAAVKECHRLLHDDLGVPRVTASLRVGTRVDKAQTIMDKVNAVEDLLKDGKG